jgi:hypothetical protein
MKSLLSFSAILAFLLIGFSCSNSDEPTPSPNTPVMVSFTANLTPVNDNGSTARGDATLDLNKTAKTFEITVNFTELKPTAGHIQNADGGIEIPFPEASVSTSPIHYSGAITDAQIVELMANNYYVNLHTTAFPTGEISGTLIKAGTSGGGGGGY